MRNIRLATSTFISLHHTTRYAYAAPVRLGPQVVRLCPTPYSRARISNYSLSVSPADHLVTWSADPNGNWLARFVFPGRADEFRIEVALTAELRAVNPFDFVVDFEAASWPFAYSVEIAGELAAYLRHEPPGPLLSNLAAEYRRGPVDTVQLLVDLNTRIYADLRYEPRDEPGVQSPEESLARAAGSCRDRAWLLAQLLRVLGFGSRFVSGYLIDLSPGGEVRNGSGDDDFSGLHAWTDVYLPGPGWVGLDPTSGTFCAEGHIPLAACAHYNAAAPVSGSVEPVRVEFSHDIRVERLAGGTASGAVLSPSR